LHKKTKQENMGFLSDLSYIKKQIKALL